VVLLEEMQMNDDEFWESMKAEFEAEAEHERQLEVYASFCPECGKYAGEADFEPDDPSVGIFGSYWYNICDECGYEYVVLEDGEIDVC
jgi:hypothetical protein